eukprot:gene7918-9405_t
MCIRFDPQVLGGLIGVACRLELRGEKDGIVAHLSAMTVEHGTEDLYNAAKAKLGTDPLREDADAEFFVKKLAGSRKGVGIMLMEQSCIAGVGNIYRSEILAEAKLHPEQPANSLSRDTVLGLWKICVNQMQTGFKSGSIWDPMLGASVYNNTICRICQGRVKQWQIGGRDVYVCSKHQLLDTSGTMAAPHAAALKTKTPAKGTPAKGTLRPDKALGGGGQAGSTEDGADAGAEAPAVGRRLKVYWKLDDAWYSGMIHSLNEKTGKHKIVYDDGETENLKLSKEVFCLQPEAGGTAATLEPEAGGAAAALEPLANTEVQDSGEVEKAKPEKDTKGKD